MEKIKLTLQDKLEKWEDIKPYFDELINENPSNSDELLEYIFNADRLSAFIDEKFARAYINMTCYTGNKKYCKTYDTLIGDISPKTEEFFFQIDKKIVESPFIKKIPKAYDLFIKRLKNSLELYREINLSLKAEEGLITSQYDKVVGGIIVLYDGKEYTLNQIQKLMETDDRDEREKIWRTIINTQSGYKNDLSAIFDRLFSLRNVIAKNCGFKNYRDYMFKLKQRFDYTPKDCFDFHESVEKEVVPIVKIIEEKHKSRLGLTELKPWDLAGIPKGEKPLKPFETGDELLSKTLKVYEKVKPELAENLKTMKENKLFDLDSRKGKAPGGYNYPLPLTNMPFIFMNAVGSQKDVHTLMHEGGHAIHTFQTKDIPISSYKQTPSESAELASMSMELITMDYWSEFYPDDVELKRAKRDQLESVIKIIPWIMVVDAIQHWMYENPEHTAGERDKMFVLLVDRFSPGVVDWRGLEEYKALRWVYQLHITTVPFYYIEYAIAQLGALQVWENYKKNKNKALDDYLFALSLGSTKTLPKIYEAAGIKFDFSRKTVSRLMNFVKKELELLY